MDYPGFQFGANVYVSDVVYSDGIVVLSNNYRKMQDLRETANYHAAAVGRRIYASKTMVKLKYLDSMFIANEQATEEIEKRINIARSAFSHLS